MSKEKGEYAIQVGRYSRLTLDSGGMLGVPFSLIPIPHLERAMGCSAPVAYIDYQEDTNGRVRNRSFFSLPKVSFGKAPILPWSI